MHALFKNYYRVKIAQEIKGKIAESAKILHVVLID